MVLPDPVSPTTITTINSPFLSARLHKQQNALNLGYLASLSTDPHDMQRPVNILSVLSKSDFSQKN